MSEKVELALKQPEITRFDYQGNSIEVKPYLSLSEMEDLSNEYIESYFSKSPSFAECLLVTAILDYCTNIKTIAEEGKIVLTFDQIYSHWDLIQQIRTRILNYNDFYARLQATIRHLDLEKNSLKSAIDYGYAKVIELIDELPSKLENLKLSDQDVAKIKEVTSSPILNEAIKIFKSGYPQESPTPRRKRSSKKSK